MKKMFLLVLATILSISAFTQRGNVELGIKGGINLSDYSENVNTSGFRTGFHIGGLAHIHTNNRKLAIQPELVFSTQGADFNDGTQQVDYINIPFLIQYLGRGGLRLETGPQVGALVSAKFKENDGDEYSIKNAFKQSDLVLFQILDWDLMPATILGLAILQKVGAMSKIVSGSSDYSINSAGD